MASIVLKIAILTQFIPAICDMTKVTKNNQFVCLYSIECTINFQTDKEIDKLYIAPNRDCSYDTILHEFQLKDTEKEKKIYVSKWTPRHTGKYQSEVWWCATRKDGTTPVVESTRRIWLYEFKYYYTLDDNNDLNFVVSDPTVEKIDLLISTKEQYVPEKDQKKYKFVKHENRLVSYAPLFTVQQPQKSFTTVFLYLHYHELSDYLTFFEKITVLNQDRITAFEHRVVGTNIVAEIKGIDLQELKDSGSSEEDIKSLFFISAQSQEDINGMSARCGSPDATWEILEVPYQLDSDQKSLVILLPLDLYGRNVQICAAFKKGEHKEYKIPIYAFQVNETASGYFKTVFHASPIGIVDITIDGDFHPLSEIRLLHPCDLGKNDPLAASFENKDKCPQRTEYKLGYLSQDSKFSGNAAYNPEELYLSIYDNQMITTHFVPHKLFFLPDKSVIRSSHTKWFKRNVFLPRLYEEHEFPYIVRLCDRWTHPLCLADDEFDSTIGLIYPSKNFVTRIETRWDVHTLVVELTVLSEKTPVLKLVPSRDLQYADYGAKCNTHLGIFPDKHSQLPKEGGTTKHKYEIEDVVPGRTYYMCLLRPSERKRELDEIESVYSEQKHVLKNPIRDHLESGTSWEFVGLINTHSVLTGVRYTFNKVGDTGNLLFPTAGFLSNININGVYLSRDLTFDCGTLDAIGYIPIIAKANDYSRLINIVRNEYHNDSWTSPDQPNESKGLWLPANFESWTIISKYLNYTGPFKANDTFYRVCMCLNGGCHFAGNATQSNIEYFELNQFIKPNDFYEALVTGTFTCLYNKRKAACYRGYGDFKRSLKEEVNLPLPQVDIRHITFDEEAKVVLVVSSDSLYVYEYSLKRYTEVPHIPSINMIFSFPQVTFLVSDSIYALVGKHSINHLIKDRRGNSLFVPISQDKSKFETEHHAMDQMFALDLRINEGADNVYIYPKGENVYYCFLVDENMELIYRTVAVDIDNRRCKIEEMYRLSMAFYFPGSTGNVVLKVTKRVLYGNELFVFFVTQFDHEKIIVLYLHRDQLNFYSTVTARSGIIDFVATDTHIICLNSHLMDNELTQYIFQIDYEHLFDTTFSYPELVEMEYGKKYTFEPKTSANIVTRFYTQDAQDRGEAMEEREVQLPIGESGLSINSLKGTVSGTPNFTGTFETTLYMDVFLGKASLPIVFFSRCPLGEEPDPRSKSCVPCPRGYYRHKIAMEACASCEEYMNNSTTSSAGSQTPLDCICKPGFYHSNNMCGPCPPGTYNDKHGSMECKGRCPDDQSSEVTGASSLEELECTCARGYYLVQGRCERCPPGSYCPGANVLLNCPENTTTLEDGNYKLDSCLCSPGYELIEGTCQKCDSISYKATVGNEWCTPCSEDSTSGVRSYTNRRGATSKGECRYCAPGFYHNGTECTSCPQKSFCTGGLAKPVQCGSNTIVKKDTGTDHTVCLCPRGYEFTDPGLNMLVARDCVKCPLNTFQPLDGALTRCIRCPENTYTLQEGSESLLDCVPLPGYYNATTANYFQTVELMELMRQNYRGADQDFVRVKCVRTEDRVISTNFTIAESLESCIDQCKLNLYCGSVYYHRLGGYASLDNSIPEHGYRGFCGIHTKFDLKVQKEADSENLENPGESSGKTVLKFVSGPVLCEIARDNVDPKFLPCPRNHYCPGGISALKFMCQSRSVTLSEGASAPSACKCLPGYYPYNELCVPCKRGYYKPTISNSNCTPCPENTTTTEEGSFMVTQCTCNKNMYTVSLSRPRNGPAGMTLFLEGESEQEAECEIAGYEDIDDLLTRQIERQAERKFDLYCSHCPHGYYCKGLWVFPKVHMPPLPCFNGSAVPISAKTHSATSCLCKPGYGLTAHDPNLDDFYGISCELCLPGYYKSVFENTPCHEACPVHSTTLPGATSESQCFCTPGFYMDLEQGHLTCKSCPKGMVCHGGVENNVHTRPTPQRGFSLLETPKALVLQRDPVWPNGSVSYELYYNDPYYQNLYDRDPAKLIHPCPNSRRCQGGGLCESGSSGLLCSECDDGYDLHHFNSDCTPCKNEAFKFVVSRGFFYATVFSLYFYNRRSNRYSEFSLVPVLKIGYTFAVSAMPLGIMAINSSSSLRNFQKIYRRLMLAPMEVFSRVDRLNCFRWLIFYPVRLFLRKFAGTDIGSEFAVPYLYVWYLQRIFAIFKLLLDVIVVMLLCSAFRLVGMCCVFERRVKSYLDHFASSIGDADLSLARFHSERDLKRTRRRLTGMLRQLLLLTAFLHLPSILLNSLPMLWCLQMQGQDAYVLLHQPEQVCSLSSPLFVTGLIIAVTSLACLILLILTFSTAIVRKTQRTGWNGLFVTGYKNRYRYWDVLHILRHCAMTSLLVFQNSVDESESEPFRLLTYLFIQLIYLLLLVRHEPYDSRSGRVFSYLEKWLMLINIFTGVLMNGAYFFDFSLLGYAPAFLNVLGYYLIIQTLLVEYISALSVSSRLGPQIRKLLRKSGALAFKFDNALLYFNYREDTVVFESYKLSTPRTWCNFKVYSILDRDYLLRCVEDVTARCVSLDKRGEFSCEFFYFYARLVLWHASCIRALSSREERRGRDFAHIALFLYYFDQKHRHSVAKTLLKYPLSDLKSHCSHYHKSSSCHEGCPAFKLKSANVCVDEVAACLQVDLLFDSFYDTGSLSLTEFYYSILGLARMRPSDIIRIYGFYMTHLKIVKNPQKYFHQNEAEWIRGEIEHLKRTSQLQGGDAALKLQRHELVDEVEELNLDLENLTKSIIEKDSSVKTAKDRISRASALIAGVENIIGGDLNNDQIVKSISKIEGGPRQKRRSTLFRRGNIGEAFKMKVA